jgi:diguanylate cyclase (GGDEF)-like protein/PAS domain S-box-containing protein
MEGEFLDVNNAMAAMLGYASREELLAVNFAGDILRDASRRAQLLGELGENDQVHPLETDWKRKDGTSLKVRLSGRAVSTEEGKRDGYEIIVEDVTKQREMENHLRQQAARDPLTGLANYRQLAGVLDNEIQRSRRTGREFALLLFDLDGLKEINSRYGHITGSEALCRVADVLAAGCRNIDTAARFGGDEFAIVLPETGAELGKLVAQRLCDNLADDGRLPKLSMSVGVAIYPADGEAMDSLVTAADVGLYAMKAKVRRAFFGEARSPQ